MKITPQTFLTADTHFFHATLWRLWGRPEDSDKRIVTNWNQAVGKNDTVLHLGDLVFSNKEKAMEICRKLNGNKYLIRGNHDGQSETWLKDCGFTTVEPVFKRFGNKDDTLTTVLFTHEPVFDLPLGWFNIHGHLHGNSHRGNVPNGKYYYDAGVDANEFKPIRLFSVLSEFKNI